MPRRDSNGNLTSKLEDTIREPTHVIDEPTDADVAVLEVVDNPLEHQNDDQISFTDETGNQTKSPTTRPRPH